MYTRLPRATLALAALAGACYGGDITEESLTGMGTDMTDGPGTTGPGEPTTSDGSSSGSTGDPGDDTTTGVPGDCYSTRDFFADKVWAPMMSTVCLQCHDPTGVAAEKGAKFRLLSPVYPGFIEANLENIRSIAGYEYEGVPLIVAKPTGVVDHGGGVLLGEGQLNDDLMELLVQLDDPIECPPTSSSESFPDVELLTPAETLRKATLHLAGRLPTAEETTAVENGGEPALLAALDAVMTEQAFFDRLADIYNDVFFTDTYLARNGVQTLNATTPDFPNVTKFFDKMNPLPPEQVQRIIRAVSREPLYLVQYIVKNDLPFTDVLLAPYTVFTPDSRSPPRTAPPPPSGRILANGGDSRGRSRRVRARRAAGLATGWQRAGRRHACRLATSTRREPRIVRAVSSARLVRWAGDHYEHVQR